MEIDFNKMCRICWCSDNLRSVFNAEIPSLCEMLMSCTQLEVCEENGLPTKLCNKCSLELERAFNFFKKCLESDYKLKNVVLESKNRRQYDSIQILPESNDRDENEVKKVQDENERKITDEIKTKNTSKCITNGGRNKFKCTYCKQSFSRRYSLKKHFRTRHAGQVQIIPQGVFRFRCAFCQKLFKMKSTLIRHLRFLHKKATSHCFSFANGVCTHSRDISLFVEDLMVKSVEMSTGILSISNKEHNIHEEISQKHFEYLKQEEDEITIKENNELSLKNSSQIDRDNKLHIENYSNSIDIVDEDILKHVNDILKTSNNVETLYQDNQTIYVVDEELFSHISKITNYKCHLCKKKFEYKINLESHLQSVHNLESLNVKFENDNGDEEIIYGIRNGSKQLDFEMENSYKCEVCQRTYNTKCTLMRHTREKHFPIESEKKKHHCEICGRAFLRLGLLERHKEDHCKPTSYQCHICGAIFEKKKKLAYHIVSHESVKKFQCNICKKRFMRSTTLNVHKKNHSNMLAFHCTICDRAYALRSGLEAHMVTHSQVRPHICNYCGKTFRFSGHLKVHIKLHTGDCRFTCTICSKKFATSSHLKYHIKVHLGQRDFKCEYCNKAFVNKSGLLKHTFSHTKVKSKACPICNKMFSHTAQVTKHLKRVHYKI